MIIPSYKHKATEDFILVGHYNAVIIMSFWSSERLVMDSSVQRRLLVLQLGENHKEKVYRLNKGELYN